MTDTSLVLTHHGEHEEPHDSRTPLEREVDTQTKILDGLLERLRCERLSRADFNPPAR